MSNFFYEQFSWAVSNFFEDASSKIIALADPILSQPDMEGEMVLPPAGAYIPSFTLDHVLPDLPGVSSMCVRSYCMSYMLHTYILRSTRSIVSRGREITTTVTGNQKPRLFCASITGILGTMGFVSYQCGS
jgi:hypothetical protein